MSHISPDPAPKTAGTFASLLASLTDSAKRSSEIWDDTALADDVATISYDQALRAHRRVPAVAEPLTVFESPAGEADRFATPLPAAGGKKRKTASITIRLTKEEEVQLHERAATAKLTVSAYLRSCIFEAESLRAQVREALSQIRAVTPSTATLATENPPHNWRKNFLTRWRAKGELKAEA